MSGSNRKNPEPRHLAERYTLRRRILSSKFTRAGDRHLAHAHEDEETTPVGASGPDGAVLASSPSASSPDNAADANDALRLDAPESTEKEATL